MILQVQIDKIESGVYEARCEATQRSCHASLSAVLKDYGEDIPGDFCQFVAVRDGGVCSGTTAVARRAKEPEAMVSELVGLVAAVHRAEEEIKYKKASLPTP